MLPLTVSKLLQVLLILALLLCHGALGSLHQLHCGPEQTPLVAEKHTSHHERAAPDSGLLGLMGCVGAFFALFLWLIHGLPRRETGGWTLSPATRAADRLAPALVPNLARGPTLPLLQVFRR